MLPTRTRGRYPIVLRLPKQRQYGTSRGASSMRVPPPFPPLAADSCSVCAPASIILQVFTSTFEKVKAMLKASLVWMTLMKSGCLYDRLQKLTARCTAVAPDCQLLAGNAAQPVLPHSRCRTRAVCPAGGLP